MDTLYTRAETLWSEVNKWRSCFVLQIWRLADQFSAYRHLQYWPVHNIRNCAVARNSGANVTADRQRTWGGGNRARERHETVVPGVKTAKLKGHVDRPRRRQRKEGKLRNT